mmetsp:Transcript_24582/g.46627  ORF Transcript_24582/g.46627 Transcript_24582/m.46627 type:complete len:352 (+) Transcript_24582:72-1127(+)
MGVHILLHTFKHDSSRPPMNTYIAHTLREGHLITINAAKPPSKVLVQIHPIPLETSTCHLLRLQYRSIAFFAGLQYAYNNILSRQAPKARSSTALRVFVSIANSQAQPVLHGLRVVVDGVNNLLVLRDALVALQLHSTLQVRNLAEHDCLELVVVRVASAHRLAHLRLHLRQRVLPHHPLLVHLLLCSENVLSYALEGLRLSLQPRHALVVQRALRLVHLDHQRLQHVLDVRAPLLLLLPQARGQLREAAREGVNGGVDPHLHLPHLRLVLLVQALELALQRRVQRLVRLHTPLDLRLHVALQLVHLVHQVVAALLLRLAPMLLLALQIVVELREALRHVRQPASWHVPIW